MPGHALDAAGACPAGFCRHVTRACAGMAPDAAARHLEFQARRLRDLRARAGDEERHREEDRALWNEHAAADGHPLAVVPSGRRELTPLPPQRIDRYRAFLREIIAEAAAANGRSRSPRKGDAGEPPSEEGDAALESVQRGICTVCAGGCCLRAGDTAHQTVDDMRRFLGRHPGLTPEDVLAAYLDRLSPDTIRDSCVNHGVAGCSLPRDMRAGLCNRYLCRALRGASGAGAFVVSRRLDHLKGMTGDHDGEIVAAAVVTAEGVQPIDDARRTLSPGREESGASARSVS